MENETDKEIKKARNALIKTIIKSIAQFVLFVIFLTYHIAGEFQKMVFVGFLILFGLLV